VVRIEFRKALAPRSEIRRAGWFRTVSDPRGCRATFDNLILNTLQVGATTSSLLDVHRR